MSNVPLTLGGDTPISTLNLPANIDHSWLMVSQNVNARLREPFGIGACPGIIERLEHINDRRFRLYLEKSYRWSDGSNVAADQVVACLSRGAKCEGKQSIQDVYLTNKNCVDVITCLSQDDLDITLQSPRYTMTPSLRNGSKASLGSYLPIGIENQGKDLIFAANEYHLSTQPESPRTVVMQFGDSAQQAGQKLLGGVIDLTATLGVDPSLWRRHPELILSSNVRTSYFFALTGFEKLDSHLQVLAPIINSCIDRSLIADATENSTVVPFTIGMIGQDIGKINTNMLSPLSIYYTDFEPNARIAEKLKEQIERYMGIPILLKCVDYQDYLKGKFKHEKVLFLEIISKIIGEYNKEGEVVKEGFDIVARSENNEKIVIILQCITTLMRSPRQSNLYVTPNSNAVFNWSEVRR